MVAGMKTYQESLSYNVGYDRDSRSSFVNLVVNNYRSLNSLTAEERSTVMDYAIKMAEQNVNYNEKDSLMEMQLAQIANVAARFYMADKDMDKASANAAKALVAMNYSIAASPGRIPLYFMKADVQLTRGENDEAVKTLQTALSLKEDYPDTHCQAANVYYFLRKDSDAFDQAGKCAQYGAVQLLKSQELIAGAVKYQTDHGNQELADILQKYLIDLKNQELMQQTQSQGQSSAQ
jgi:tetratricopeptide (TPR) repeat protein